MLDFLFIGLFFLFPVFLFFLIKKLKIELFRVSIISFLIWSIFAFSYIGILPLYFGLDSYRYISGVQDKNIIFQILLFTSWSSFTLIIGFFLCRAVFKKYFYTPIHSPVRSLEKTEIFMISIFLIIIVIVTFLYLSKVSEIALFTFFTEGKIAASVSRSNMGNNFSGKYHWYSLFMNDLLNVLTFTVFTNYLLSKNKYNIYLFGFVFLCSVFTSIMATEKSKFCFLIIGLLLSYFIVKKDGRLPLKACFKILPFIIVPVYFFYFYFMGMSSSSFLETVVSIFSRLFTGQIQPSYHYLEFFPKNHDFLWGRSFPNPGKIFNFDQYRLTVEIMNWRYPDLSQSGIVGSMPTIFWGELYANFGTSGVLFFPVFVGFGLYIVEHIIDKFNNTPVKIGFYVWAILHYMNLSLSGISNFIADSYIFMIFIFVYLISISSCFPFFKKYNENKKC